MQNRRSRKGQKAVFVGEICRVQISPDHLFLCQKELKPRGRSGARAEVCV